MAHRSAQLDAHHCRAYYEPSKRVPCNYFSLRLLTAATGRTPKSMETPCTVLQVQCIS
ncbi:hypothetical protein BDV93DRAFT_274183 [Ceratobasidium sp. AG-I]|nr:hypothetical protein BDV93DRAFT_274183 [Ceratobasidium sp. AG-I]